MTDLENFNVWAWAETCMVNAKDLGSDISIRCVSCPDKKSHLWIKKKNFKVFHCFRCDYKGTLYQLLRAIYGQDRIMYIIKRYSGVKSKSTKAVFEDSSDERRREKVYDGTTQIEFFRAFPEHKKNLGFYADMAYKYLRTRGFTDGQIDKHRLGFAEVDSKYSGRIIVPFFEYGKVVYFQARDFTYQSDTKIMNPSKRESPYGSKDVLFNFDNAMFHVRLKRKPLIITEGWASSISAGLNAVAIQGKEISDSQRVKILNMKPRRVVVMLDAGFRKEAEAVAKQLVYYIDDTYICKLPKKGTDPNNYSRGELNKLVGQAERF